jgi:hypothetical protein
MMKTTERVPFRLIVTPCCGTMLCYVNHRLPNYCSECGTHIFATVKGCVTATDMNAILKTDLTEGALV